MASGDSKSAELDQSSKLSEVLSNKLNYDSYIGSDLPNDLSGTVVPAVNATEEDSILRQGLFDADNPHEEDTYLNDEDVKDLDNVGDGEINNQALESLEDIANDDQRGDSDWEDEEEEEDLDEDEDEDEGSDEDEDEEGEEGEESDDSEILDEENLDKLEDELGEVDKEINEHDKELEGEETPSVSMETTDPDLPSTSSKPASTPNKKRKRKKDKKDKSKKKLKSSKPNYKRKNIRKIIKETDLDKETIDAQNEEFERKKRLNELKKNLVPKPIKEEKDSELKSLLQAAEDEAEEASMNNDVIILDKKDVEKEEEREVIELSSEDEDEEGVTIVQTEDDLIEEEDMNNAGSHINDDVNCPDELGRVLVNLSHPPADPDVFLSPQIARAIKPHQIGGIRFLYDNVVECLERHESTPGFGCILAHSMGLGKTLQMIGFIDIYLRFTKAKKALCIVPINTLQNWLGEFNMWSPDPYVIPPEMLNDIHPRNYKVFLLNDNYKTTAARAKVIAQWKEEGGVLLMGYEMYRLLSSKKSFAAKPKKSKKINQEPEVIDVDEEDKNKSLMIDIFGALVNPGPDIVICDEGHRIKNSHAGISQSLKNIKTRRRVVLTGYPLQNNLQEYWCMVDFVRPNFLGTKTEFSNMFERPMSNGLCVDSTDKDLRLMRHRAYVLHSLLEGFVQRRGHAVLNLSLPEKREYVFMIRMSPIQRALYNRFMSTISDTALGSWANNNPLKSFSVCCKIWNHPDVLHKIVTQRKLDDDDLDLEGNEQGGGRKKSKVKDTTDGMITYDWADELMKDYVPGVLEHSGKMVFLNSIIEESLALGDKLLIFSQSLFTLNLIEEYLSQRNVPRPDMNEKWCKNRSYLRLDGSTSAQEREKLIAQFNQPNNVTWLFLLSTRAGCLGINLIGANRVVVFDASWNPCHDCQAVCRVFRFGQKKNSYIYRLVTDNTLERKIYDRQVSKQKMSDRVIDDLNPDNMRRGTNDLLQYSDRDFPEVDVGDAFKDSEDVVMKNILHKQSKWITELPFTHESLLLDRRELRLSKREKQLAKEGYARDKKMSVSYSRPSYSAFYPNNGGLPILRNQQGIMVNRGGYMRPVASVKPMISTPVPMGLKTGAKGTGLGSNIMRPGVSVHQVITTTEIVLPGSNTATQAGTVNRIPPGQKVLVIKTLKGVYIRTADKKLFAVRSKGLPGPSMAPPGPLNLSSSSLTTLSSTQSTGLPISSTSTSSSPSNLNIKIITSSGANVSKLGDKKLIINRNNNSATVKAMPKIIRAPSKSPITSELLQNDLLSSIYSQTDSVNAILRNQDSNSSDSTAPSSEKSGDTTVPTSSQTTSISSIANSVSAKLDKIIGPVNTNPFGSIIEDGSRGKLGAPFSLNFGKGVKPVGISKPATVTSNKSSTEDNIMSELLSIDDEHGNNGNKTMCETGTNTTIARLPVIKPKPTTDKSPKHKPESDETSQPNNLPSFPGQGSTTTQGTKPNESSNAITSSAPNFTGQHFNPLNFGIQSSNASNFSNPGLNIGGNNPNNSVFGQNTSTFGYPGQNSSFGLTQGFSGQSAGFQNFPGQNSTSSNFQGQSSMASNFPGQKTPTFGSAANTLSNTGSTYSYPNQTQNTSFPQDSFFNQGNKDNNSESTSDLLNLCNQYNNTDSLGLSNMEDISTNHNNSMTGTDNSQKTRANNSKNTGETTQPSTTQENNNQDIHNVNNAMSNFNQSFNNMDSTSSTPNQNFSNYSNNYNPMGGFGNLSGNNFGSNMSKPMVDQGYSNPYSNMAPNPFFPYFPQHNYPPMMGQPPGMGMIGGMPMMGGFNPANMMSGMPQQMMPAMSTPSSTGSSNTANQSESSNQQSSPQVPMPQGMYGMPYMNSPMNPFMYNSSPNSMYGMPMMNPFSSMPTQQMNSIPHGINSGMIPSSSGEQSDNPQSGSNPTSSAN